MTNRDEADYLSVINKALSAPAGNVTAAGLRDALKLAGFEVRLTQAAERKRQRMREFMQREAGYFA